MRRFSAPHKLMLAWLRFAARSLLVALALSPAAASAAEFEVTRAAIEETNGIYMLDAEFVYAFGEAPLEALANGVPLTIHVEVSIKRKRRYVWDDEVARVVQVYQIHRHELTDRYIVTNLANNTRRNFDSVEVAIAEMGRIAPIPVAEVDKLEAGKAYRARMRASLDIESLPGPLRPLAWIKPAWRLGSGWHKWNFTP